MAFSITFLLFVAGCDDYYAETQSDPDDANNTNTSIELTTDTMSDTVIPEMQLAPKSGDTIATIYTNQGELKMLLYTNLAPETTKNFIELSKEGNYNGVIFHRIIKDFMIQTGDFENSNGTGGYTYQGPGTSLKDEFGAGLKHVKGAVSMANAGPNTGGSQFFIVQKEDGTDWLDGMHAIFGYIYEGMDNVDKIASVEVDYGDKPLEDIIIEKIEISTL